MGEGKCEVSFAIEEAGFSRDVGDGGKEFGSNGLGLSARRSALSANNEAKGYLHALKPELLLPFKPHRELHQRLDHVHAPRVLVAAPRLAHSRS